ncbi:hypothetical protein Ccrd_004620 [Cynara cardunculus var. scolymus]|uniref:Uncharacterized protein n=1 Tax=Cynara cardunculus var. scolymus TaxID=59895 RepID=A0A103XM92_CYNCS|nr:hypothetical protein Ccrd_004620 [Cynara cardunculus var. scolymus]
MDLGCLDLGCIEKQISQSSGDSDINPNDYVPSTSKPPKNKVLKEANQPSPHALNRLTGLIKKPRRKTSPLSWFPRKKGDSYLKRKLKLLQVEVDGMNSTLDETLGDTNPHFSKVLREKIAVREAAHKVIEARKAALVEASWCRILRAARIESKEAESLLVKAEKSAAEAFESAKEIGVIMYEISDCPRKHCKIETSAVSGGESTTATHTVTTTFDTAFEVDKQVAAAVKAAFVRLSSSASIGKEEFKELLKRISQNPDLDESYQDISESESDAGPDFESGSQRNEEMESSKEKQRENLVDMMLVRLRCLQEEELNSLATIVATCGLNAALAEAENTFPASGVNGGRDLFKEGRTVNSNVDGQASKKQQAHEELPGLDKFLVKRLTRLEREIQDAKSARTKEAGDKLHSEEKKVSSGSEKEIEDAKKNIVDKDNKISKEAQIVSDLGSMLTKHTSKLEKEIEESKRKCGNEYEPKWKRSERLKQETKEIPSLGEVLVKRVSRLEREVQEAKEKENVDMNRQRGVKEKETNGVESLDKVLVKHVSRLEKEKMSMEEEVKVKRRDRKSELEQSEGSLDQIMVKHKSRLEREKVGGGVQESNNQMKNPLVAKREAREKELQEAWGGMSFGNSIRPHLSRLQRDQASFI